LAIVAMATAADASRRLRIMSLPKYQSLSRKWRRFALG
jgi:hypothetical protein